MKTFYLDYKKNKGDKHMLHRGGCQEMPKVDNCLLMGEFSCPDNLFHYAKDQFPNWNIECCPCCGEKH
ncbi:MAG: hypothetical protein N4A74_12810 [Carboxylicivirga sp.]|nr:hypothetical protein [Carboxylicivirga sp.]